MFYASTGIFCELCQSGRLSFAGYVGIATFGAGRFPAPFSFGGDWTINECAPPTGRVRPWPVCRGAACVPGVSVCWGTSAVASLTLQAGGCQVVLLEPASVRPQLWCSPSATSRMRRHRNPPTHIVKRQPARHLRAQNHTGRQRSSELLVSAIFSDRTQGKAPACKGNGLNNGVIRERDIT